MSRNEQVMYFKQMQIQIEKGGAHFTHKNTAGFLDVCAGQLGMFQKKKKKRFYGRHLTHTHKKNLQNTRPQKQDFGEILQYSAWLV